MRTTRRKGLAALACAVSLALVATACSSTPTPEGSAAPSATAESTGSVASASASNSSTAAASGTPDWCGKKPIVLGYSDGNGSNGWRKVTLALLKQAVAQCPNITNAIYLDARGSTQTQIAQLNSLIAQGVNVIVTMPDAGAPLVPVMRKAMEQGIKVVPFTQPPEGSEAGRDFVAAVVADNVKLGEQWGEWMCKALNGKGNVVDIGGTPGNSQSDDELEGLKKAFEACGGGIKILDPAPVTTNWQVASYQQAMTGLIAKYPNQIDGIIVDYGGGFNGAVTAYKNANLKVPPVATNSDNQLACSLMAQGTNFVMYTSGNKQVVNALQQGIAAVNGTTPPQAALYPQSVVFDTISGPPAECAKDLPDGASLGEGLTDQELKQILSQ